MKDGTVLTSLSAIARQAITPQAIIPQAITLQTIVPQAIVPQAIVPQVLCQQFAEAYADAAERSVEISYTYQISDFIVRLTFAGSALVSLLTPALAHLQRANAKPDVTFYLWDGASTGIEAPYPASLTEVGLRGELPEFSNEQVIAAIQTDVRAISILDRSQERGFYWIDTPDSLRAYERAAPLKLLLHWWLRQHGHILIHAGVVGTSEGAALLVGKTGVGKSTATLACLNAGLQYIADDRCLLTLESTPQAYCLYNSAKVYPSQMEHFPNLRPSITNRHESETEKALIYVQQMAPAQVAERLPIRVVLLARIAESCATTLTTVARSQLFQEFVSSTLVYQAGTGQMELEMMCALIRQFPCYQINLGHDLTTIAPVVRQAIQDTVSQSK